MRATIVMAAVLLAGALRPESAHAWASANRWGGSTEHTYGATSHQNAWGGSTSHAYGEGTEHTNAYGGSTAHGWNGGTEHTNAYGGSTYGAYGAGATHTYASGASVYHPPAYGYPGGYHPPGYGYGYPAYHPPVAVPYYSASGCYGCAAAAGAVVGATVVGAAAVASASAANAANANAAAAYSSGYAAGSAVRYTMGVNYAALPAGCAYQAGPNEYLCGGSWFRPAYGANGLYYTVVPAP